MSFGAYGAIRRVYELGIAKGTGDGTTFSPGTALVTRGQMAAFITRALAHTNARPAGVSVQSDKDEADTSSGRRVRAVRSPCVTTCTCRRSMRWSITSRLRPQKPLSTTTASATLSA